MSEILAKRNNSYQIQRKVVDSDREREKERRRERKKRAQQKSISHSNRSSVKEQVCRGCLVYINDGGSRPVQFRIRSVAELI